MMKKIYKKPVFIIAAVIILIIAGYFYFSRAKKSNYETFVAKRGTVIQEVSVTGKVKSAENVDLAFEKTGKVAWVNVKVGDKVRRGETLVTLVNGDISAQLDQAKASVSEQQAKLDELKKGTRPEEIQAQQAKVDNARTDLIDKIQDAYTKSDDAVRNKVDQIFSNPRTYSPQFNYYLNTESVLKTDVEWRRVLVENILSSWKSSGDISAAAAKTNLGEIKLFLDKAALAINNASASSNLSQTTLDAWRADISTARTNINTAIVNLSSSESTLIVEENQLTLERAGNTPEQIANQEAKLEQAQANVKNFQAQLEKTILWAPINGVVTKQDAKNGEIVAANSVIVSIISESQFEIEANVPEADIAKVKVGDSARVTLDAYGSDTFFDANVVKIDPGETMIEGVATYKTTFQFTKEDQRIKSGMTANIDILTDKRENMINIPQRAVVSRDGEKTVQILDGQKAKEVNVKTGLRGSDGNIEILEGVKEGDKVILP
ncbi:MAG: efflux RND transporter periplasmic adaptor subunit [Candidatus Parcubacteria bacterium]|nr:efflux RND transporter periplasmic adaptor subunit [Candidatus Parcubacteria bacterium]